MDDTTLLEESKGEHCCTAKQAQSLYQVCQRLPTGWVYAFPTSSARR
ncbi:MAG TPA: hypothetical protein VGF67_07095 [Ktedonobacteraceae bacterium]